MFTGIITAVSPIVGARKRGSGKRVTVAVPPKWALHKGDSVAVDGICTTVVGTSRGAFEADYMRTTLQKTTADEFGKGRLVNLERPLRYGGRVSGHFVLGHIDGRGRIRATKGNTLVLEIPKALRSFIATCGSITVNGVALTVAERRGGVVTIALIPHTLSFTNLGKVRKGDRVNVEVDLLARYATTRLNGKKY